MGIKWVLQCEIILKDQIEIWEMSPRFGSHLIWVWALVHYMDPNKIWVQMHIHGFHTNGHKSSMPLLYVGIERKASDNVDYL